jgi:hypothetical protein
MFVWVVGCEVDNRIHNCGFLYLNFNAYTISVNKKVLKVYGAVFFLCVWLNVKLLCMELACCRI